MGFARQEYWRGLPLPSPGQASAWLYFLTCGSSHKHRFCSSVCRHGVYHSEQNPPNRTHSCVCVCVVRGSHQVSAAVQTECSAQKGRCRAPGVGSPRVPAAAVAGGALVRGVGWRRWGEVCSAEGTASAKGVCRAPRMERKLCQTAGQEGVGRQEMRVERWPEHWAPPWMCSEEQETQSC